MMYARAWLLLLSLCATASAASADSLNDAAKTGDAAAIEVMIKSGAPVNPADGSRPPLYFAVKHNHASAVAALVAHGADVNAATKFDGPLLLVAARQDNSEIIERLVGGGADVHATYEYETALHIAAKRGCLACVKILVMAGADVNSVITGGDYARSPLHLATLYEHLDVADYLMSHGAALPSPNSTLELLATANPDEGKRYFVKDCGYCHDADKGTAKKRGPNLWNILGRERASVPDQLYSKSFRKWKGKWTYEDLNYWIGSFAVGTPGVMMEITPIADDKLRADIIAYLRLASDNPLQLP